MRNVLIYLPALACLAMLLMMRGSTLKKRGGEPGGDHQTAQTSTSRKAHEVIDG